MKKDGIQTRNRKLSSKSKKSKGKGMSCDILKPIEDYPKFPSYGEPQIPNHYHHTPISSDSAYGMPPSHHGASLHHPTHHSMAYSSQLCNPLYQSTQSHHVPVPPCSMSLSTQGSNMIGAMAWVEPECAVQLVVGIKWTAHTRIESVLNSKDLLQ